MIFLPILLLYVLAGVHAYSFKVILLKPLYYNHVDVAVDRHGCRYTMSSANIIGVNNGTFVSSSCDSQMYPDVSVYSSPSFVIQYLKTSIGDKYDCRLIRQNIGKVEYMCSLSGTRATKTITTTTTRRATRTTVVTAIITATKTRTKNITTTVAAHTTTSNSGSRKLKNGAEYNEYHCISQAGCIDSCGNNMCNEPLQASSASIPYATGVFMQR
jgi:hypothetical protein